MIREVNARVIGNGLKLLNVNGGRFELDQLLFADDTALVEMGVWKWGTNACATKWRTVRGSRLF